MGELDIAVNLIDKNVLIQQYRIDEIELELNYWKKQKLSEIQKKRLDYWQHQKEIHLAKRDECLKLCKMINEIRI